MKIQMDSMLRGTKPGANIIHEGSRFEVLDVDGDMMLVKPIPGVAEVRVTDRSLRAMARINRRIV